MGAAWRALASGVPAHAGDARPRGSSVDASRHPGRLALPAADACDRNVRLWWWKRRRPQYSGHAGGHLRAHLRRDLYLRLDYFETQLDAEPQGRVSPGAKSAAQLLARASPSPPAPPPQGESGE